jgi:CRISPR-associated protein Cas5t
MKECWLYLQAPFAAYRWLQAGVYRASSPTMPPSAAWGLVLNLAGIEIRAGLDQAITTIDEKAPPLQLAIGVPVRQQEGSFDVRFPSVTSIYQQLHSYPVGSSGKELAAKTHGAKYWIVPIRREVLVDCCWVLGVRGPAHVIDRIGPGLAGALEVDRYGLPFAGDNSFLFDRIELLEAPMAARWFAAADEDEPPGDKTSRLTIGIDRSDSSRTTSKIFYPTAASSQPPDEAWVWAPKNPNP